MFGSTGSGSPTILYANKVDLPGDQESTDERLHYRFDGKKSEGDKWIEYLLWTMAREGDTKKLQPYRRPYSKPETPFKLYIRELAYRLPKPLRDNPKYMEDSLQLVNLCVWLLAHLGGIGTRSRRGLGSTHINPIFEECSLLPLFSFALQEDRDSLVEHLSEELKRMRTLLSHVAEVRGISHLQQQVQGEGSLPSFDVINKQYCSIWVAQWKNNPCDDYLEALRLIGELLAGGRTKYGPRRGAIFGLASGINKRTGYSVRFHSQETPSLEITRRASPLLFHVHRLQDGYAVVISLLKSTFLRRNTYAVVNNERVTPQFELIEDWLNEFSSDDIDLMKVEGW